jgi:ADP-Ribosyltransferase in polyvalent proteins
MRIAEIISPTPSTGPFFHGTASQFDQFERNHDVAGRPSSSLGGFSFTSDPRSAHGYAVYAARKTGGRPRMIQAGLNMQNPLDITDTIRKLQKYKRMSFGDAKRVALQQFDPATHDGVIFRGDSLNPDEYVVFNPEQIAQQQLDMPAINARWNR